MCCLLASIFYYAHKRASYYKGIFSDFQPEELHVTSSSGTAEMVIYDLALHEVQTRKDSEPYSIDVHAKKSSFSRRSDMITCRDVCCDVTSQEKKQAWFKAGTCLVNRLTKKIVFPEQVVGWVKDCDIVGSDALFDIGRNWFEFKGSVSCKNDSFSLKANRGTFDLKEKKLELSGGVRTEFLQRPAGNNSGK